LGRFRSCRRSKNGRKDALRGKALCGRRGVCRTRNLEDDRSKPTHGAIANVGMREKQKDKKAAAELQKREQGVAFFFWLNLRFG